MPVILRFGAGFLMTNLSSLPHLTVRAVRSTPVQVPPNFVLGTSMGAFRQVPLLLIDLETEEGVTGHSYLFGYFRAALPAASSLVGEVERLVKGSQAKPAELRAKLTQRFTLIGVQGIVRMAMRSEERRVGKECRSAGWT